nr:hypothetical protein [Tanacetum cinerariifolium]
MMKGSDIGIQEKKAKLFNEWERFNSNEGESIESYYHRNLNGYNEVQNVGNQVAQNPRVQNVGTQNGLIGVQRNDNLVAARAEGNAAGPRRRDAAYIQTQLLIAQKEEAVIQLQAEEYDLMAAAADLDEIEEVNANCILMANLQQASSSGTQTDSAPVYDSDGSAENHYWTPSKLVPQQESLAKCPSILQL